MCSLVFSCFFLDRSIKTRTAIKQTPPERKRDYVDDVDVDDVVSCDQRSRGIEDT